MRWFLIVSQIVYALLLPLWFVSWLMLVMIFDSGIYAGAVLLYAAYSIYPVAAVLCSIFAWLSLRRNKRRSTVILNLIPALWPAAFGIAYIFTRS